MSDAPKEGLGIFVNRKEGGGSSPSSVAGPKNVKKRWLVVGGSIMAFSIFAATFFKDAPTPVTVSKKAESMIDVTPKGAEEKSWQARSQADIAALKESVIRLSDENKTLTTKLSDKDKMGRSNQQLPEGVVPPPTPPGGASNLTSIPSIPSPPAPPVSPSSMRLPAASPLSGPKAPASAPDYSPSGSSSEPLIFSPPPSTKSSKLEDSADAVKAKVSFKKNPYSGLLPAGSFAPVALLNGLDAGTATANQSNPQPVLMNVLDQATLPGSAKYRIKSCFVLASAYGDLSAERVYFRLAQMSCVDKADRLVMTTPVKGYLVDSDGKLGMRGVVSDRQGAKLGKALLAGFAQGLGSALGGAQGSTTSSALGAVSTISGGAALKQSGLSGASTAASQIAQFYLKEAQNIFPVITIDNGRTGSMVFTDSVALQWGQGDTLYAKEVKPE